MHHLFNIILLSSAISCSKIKATLFSAAAIHAGDVVSLVDAPTGTNATVNLAISAEGESIVSYRFKIGPSASINCSNSSGYSSEIDIAQAITHDITPLADGSITICAVGKNAEGVWQSWSQATRHSWTKLTGNVAIYRSIGFNNTTALATGVGNLFSISGTLATFSVALPNNVGVGDVIQYDSDNDAVIDSVAFIIWRNSSQSFLVQDALGGPPAAVSSDSDWSIFRAYTALNNAYTGNENGGIDAGVRDFDSWVTRDLVASNQQWNFALYNDATDTEGGLYLEGWTTGADNFIRFFTPYLSNQVGISQRHSGTISSGYQRTGYIWFRDNYVRVDGVIFNGVTTANDDILLGVWLYHHAPSKGYFTNNIIYMTGAHRARLIWLAPHVTTELNEMYFINNIVINNAADGDAIFINISDDGNGDYDYAYLYNNTFISMNNGHAILRNEGNIDLRNNLLAGYGAASSFGDWGGGGAFQLTSTNNVHNRSNASLPVSYAAAGLSVDNQIFTFLNSAGGDFRLSISDTGAQGRGIDLSNNGIYNFSLDITGATRTLPWNVGASNSY